MTKHTVPERIRKILQYLFVGYLVLALYGDIRTGMDERNSQSMTRVPDTIQSIMRPE